MLNLKFANREFPDFDPDCCNVPIFLLLLNVCFDSEQIHHAEIHQVNVLKVRVWLDV